MCPHRACLLFVFLSHLFFFFYVRRQKAPRRDVSLGSRFSSASFAPMQLTPLVGPEKETWRNSRCIRPNGSVVREPVRRRYHERGSRRKRRDAETCPTSLQTCTDDKANTDVFHLLPVIWCLDRLGFLPLSPDGHIASCESDAWIEPLAFSAKQRSRVYMRLLADTPCLLPNGAFAVHLKARE